MNPDPVVRQAHHLLDAARQGAQVSEAQILRCLRETGDLSDLGFWRAKNCGGEPMNVDDLHRHLLVTGRQILADAGYGLVSDEFAIQWAEMLLRQNVVALTSAEICDAFDAETPADLEP